MADIVYALLWAPLFTAAGIVAHRVTGGQWLIILLPRTVSQGLLCGGLGTAVAFALNGEWLASAIGVVQMAVAALLWWHRRRKRRRAAATLGAKSKALVASLVRRAREESRPRRVLSPVPGAACEMTA
jgi:uncharacterized membrane protein YfcA